MNPFPAARAAVLAALLCLLVPAQARAGTYTVRSCANGSTSGWSGFPPPRVVSTCRPGGGALKAQVEGAAQEPAGWRFTAPPDTDLAGFSIVRGHWRNAGVAFGTPVYQAKTWGPGRGYFRAVPNFGPVAIEVPPGVERADGLTGQAGLEVAVVCGGGGSCLRPAASFELADAALVLRDDHAPAIERVDGGLATGGEVSGVRALAYTASDRGGGVARGELWLDGRPVAEAIADGNGGACAPQQGTFAAAVPCRLRASSALTLDTRRFAEGAHRLVLRVYDATGTNHADWGRRIVIDNVPPPANAAPPMIAGEPREGAMLTATPGTWSGAHPAFAYRWQRDEGEWLDLPGATSARHRVDGDDVGTRLRVRVTATNAEGSALAYSAPTGLVVAAGDGGPPPASGPPDAPGSAPTPGGGRPTASRPGAAPAGLRIAAWLGSDERRSLTVAYGRAVSVRGVARGATGAPARGVTLSLLAAIDGRWRKAGAALTDERGRFTVLAGPGPSRRLRVATGGARSRSLRLSVRAGIVLRTARQGRATLLRGVLRGGHVPPGGVFVTIQARHARHWRTLTTLVTDGHGGFHARVITSDRIRAAVVRQPGYPFAAGVSSSRAPRTGRRTSR